jgi:type I restriction enzyme S subunit
MLYRHLTNLGCELRRDRVKKRGQDGPDFGVLNDGRTIWIEAIVPAPEGILAEFLQPLRSGEVEARHVPHEQMLLRWTGALRYKAECLQRYREKRIIAEADCTVIAINGCRLSEYPRSDAGVSRFPLAVEAVFPVGPMAVPITPQGHIDGEPERTIRYWIWKLTGVEVSTANFLDPDYANVSAVLGCSCRDMLDGDLPLTLVHNPLAKAPLPRGILDAKREFVADEEGDGYLLHALPD